MSSTGKPFIRQNPPPQSPLDQISDIVDTEDNIAKHLLPDEPMTYAEKYRGVEMGYNEGKQDEELLKEAEGLSRCAKCGAAVRDDEQRCSNCGAREFTSYYEAKEPEPEPVEKTPKEPEPKAPDVGSEPEGLPEPPTGEGPTKGKINVSLGQDEKGLVPMAPTINLPDPSPSMLPPESGAYGSQTPKEVAYRFGRAVVDSLNRRKFTKPYFFQNASPEDFEIFVRDTILEALYTSVPEEENPHVNDYVIEYDKGRTMLGFEFDTDVGSIVMVLKAPGQGDTWQIIEFDFTPSNAKSIGIRASRFKCFKCSERFASDLERDIHYMDSH